MSRCLASATGTYRRGESDRRGGTTLLTGRGEIAVRVGEIAPKLFAFPVRERVVQTFCVVVAERAHVSDVMAVST